MIKDIKTNDKKKEGYIQSKAELKIKIRNLLEKINQKATAISQIDKLQKLNEKYQVLLTEDSKIKNYD